jgi:hypothetical protein
MGLNPKSSLIQLNSPELFTSSTRLLTSTRVLTSFQQAIYYKYTVYTRTVL